MLTELSDTGTFEGFIVGSKEVVKMIGSQQLS
jgi:hypothetical protein